MPLNAMGWDGAVSSRFCCLLPPRVSAVALSTTPPLQSVLADRVLEAVAGAQDNRNARRQKRTGGNAPDAGADDAGAGEACGLCLPSAHCLRVWLH